MNKEDNLKMESNDKSEVLESSPEKGLFGGTVQRKTFLKLMGAQAAMLSAGCYRRPVEKIIPYLNTPEYIKPGVSNYYSSVCQGCSGGCGVIVKTREGRPLKLEGNPEHPISKGGLCAYAHGQLLDMYDPERARGPMNIIGGKGKTIEWDALNFEAKSRLEGAKGKLRILTGQVFSPLKKAQIGALLKKFGGTHIEFDPNSPEEAIAKGQEKSYGKAIVPNYHFDRARVVFSIGADFMGTWISPVEFTKDFLKGRELRKGGKKVSQLISAETMISVTGSNADIRLPIRPGDERKLVLGIASILGKSGGKQYGNAVSGIDSKAIAGELGLELALLEKVAGILASAKGESLVVAGGASTQSADAVELQVAVNLLNSMLENDGRTVDYSSPRKIGGTEIVSGIKKLEKDLQDGKVSLLIINEVNPVYHLGEGWKDLMAKAGFTIAISDRINETTQNANMLAAVSSQFESWGDSEAVQGIRSIQQPTIQPLFQTKPFGEILAGWTGSSESSYTELKNSYGKAPLGWEEFLKKGFYTSATKEQTASRNFRMDSVNTKLNPSTGLALALYETVTVKNGSGNNNPHRLELPEPVTKATWDNFIAVSPHYAEKEKLSLNDLVTVTSNGKKLDLPVLIQAGLHPDTVAIALGFGRTKAGRIGTGVGKNSYEFAKSENGLLQFSGLDVKIEKTGKRYKLAITQDYHRMDPPSALGVKWEARNMVASASVQDYEKNPSAGIAPTEIPQIHVNGKLVQAKGLNPKHEYKGYKWGLAVDLTRCTGCASCTMSCNVENNVPAAGRNEIRVGREMHWIRIDRYFTGDESKPESVEVVHQPVMCQHCDDAPCETVCPVAATTHSQEGTNDMAYNRCVGTRYCSNNCPYKVRRYNWLEHWYGKETTQAPAHLALNPDITVRTRGVMEKCNMCIGRIAEKKANANNQNRKLKDGELKTACQESCPADAIVFGDVNNPESEVSKLTKDPRSYKILEFLNIGPQVAYMSRIRNKG